MYKISYEKCVCFLFLVILAVLSCSGFRIDNLAMTDIISNKKNSQQHTLSSDEFFDRLLPPQMHHRIRHHRHLRAQQQQQQRTFEPHHQQQTDEIPLVQARSQRSNDKPPGRQNQRNKQHLCQEEDISWKAYRANTVVVAKAESTLGSFHTQRNTNYTVFFRVLQRLKNSSFPVDDTIQLKFASDRPNSSRNNNASHYCADHEEHHHRSHRSQFLVKAKIEKSKEYILFLDAYGAHNYSVVGTPEPHRRRRKIPQCIARVASPSFRPRPVKVEKLERMHQAADSNGSKRLKLVCKVKGFPIPKISWKRNDTPLHSNPHMRIIYKNDGKDRRKSTLVIKSPAEMDWGRYECTARGVDGSRASKDLWVERRPTNSRTPMTIPSEKPNRGDPCNETMNRDFCVNGGRCFYLAPIDEYGCDCANGYTGKRCLEKSSDQSSEHEKSDKLELSQHKLCFEENCELLNG